MKTVAAIKALLYSAPLTRGATAGMISAAAVVLLTAHAHAACTQGNLTGIWRFNFDTGYTPSSSPYSRRLSCLLKFKSNGVIAPRKCDAVGTGNDGEFIIDTVNTKLRMNANNCEARFIGNFSLRFGSIYHPQSDGKLSISADKQMMLGWTSYNGAPFVIVTALKRAIP